MTYISPESSPLYLPFSLYCILRNLSCPKHPSFSSLCDLIILILILTIILIEYACTKKTYLVYPLAPTGYRLSFTPFSMRAAQPDTMAAVDMNVRFRLVEKNSVYEFATFPLVRGKPVKKDSHTPLVDFDWKSLYEIIDMKISHVDGHDVVEVHGKIALHCSSGFMFLFNRKEGNSVTINLPGTITLMTPAIGINASDRIGIIFDLEGDLKELNERFVGWTPDYHPLDTLLTCEVEGRNYSLVLRYIVFEEALLANIEIKLLTGDGKGKAAIYGNITASFTEMSGLQFDLFKNNCDDSIIVSEEELIPLSRSLISVPFASELDIKVNLSNAIAIVRFMPESLGEYVGIISDQIEVKVTFWSYRNHLRKNRPKRHFHEYSEFLEYHL